MKLNTLKAGMADIDVVKIEKVLNSDSAKTSKYYKHEEEMESKAKQKFDVFVKRAVKYRQNPSVIDQWEDEVDAEITKYTPASTKNSFLHMDMDAFFANIETRDNPTYASLPVAIGSTRMISTSNYIARKYGVRAAMAGFVALKLCPDLIIIPCNHKKYQAIGSEIRRKVLAKYDQNLKSSSCDEATLHVTSYCRENNVSPHELGQRIKNDIFTLTGLTCSIGIGPNPIISKIAAEYQKPDGLYALQFDTISEIQNFLSDLRVRKVPSLGKRSENLLNKIGILDLGDIFRNRGLLWGILPRKTAMSYILSSCGIFTAESYEDNEGLRNSKLAFRPSTSFSPISSEHSISKERTFDLLTSKYELLCIFKQIVSDILDQYRAYSSEFSVNTVTLKLKNKEFENRQRSSRLKTPMKDGAALSEIARKLLASEYYPLDIRLLGVKFTLQAEPSTGEGEMHIV